jgi:hypothetical protein
MKELHPYSGPQDQYLMSLLNMLRTQYKDVEVLRGRVEMKFFYADPVTNESNNLIISREVIEKSMADKVIPEGIQQILTNTNYAV